VVIAVTVVRMVQMIADQVINVIAVWNRLVSAVGAMRVSLFVCSTPMVRGAVGRI
jgi:hypothetical protein